MHAHESDQGPYCLYVPKINLSLKLNIAADIRCKFQLCI